MPDENNVNDVTQVDAAEKHADKGLSVEATVSEEGVVTAGTNEQADGVSAGEKIIDEEENGHTVHGTAGAEAHPNEGVPPPVSTDDLQAALSPVLERLREIKNDVVYNKSKDDLIVKLDRQLQEHTRKSDQELAVLKPALIGIIRVIDAIEDYLPHVRNTENPPATGKIAGFIDSLAVELRDILAGMNVGTYTVAEDEVFNPKRHFIVETVLSDDSSKYNIVKEMKRPGYEYCNDETEKRIMLRQAKVLAYKAPRLSPPPSSPPPAPA